MSSSSLLRAKATFLLATYICSLTAPLSARDHRTPDGLRRNAFRTSSVAPALPSSAAASPAEDRITHRNAPEEGGPGTPEFNGFKPVSDANLVDLFTGDFTYSIPLGDVGGYPITLAYNSNVGAHDEASWVGLGWNLNLGAINRQVRGLPDDFKGEDIERELHMTPREELELGVGVGLQIMGVEALKSLGLGLNLGISHDNYEGWGMSLAVKGSSSFGSEQLSGSLGLEAGIDSRSGGFMKPNAGLSGSSREGHRSTTLGSFVGMEINSREGYKQTTFGFQLSREFSQHEEHREAELSSGSISFPLGFAAPGYMPTSETAMKNYSLMIHGSLGGEVNGVHINVDLEGTYSRQEVTPHYADPAFGYIYAHESDGNSLMDINREKDGPYQREIPNLPVTAFTYDIFQASAEGLDARFRPMRGDIGMVHDPRRVNETTSGGAGVEIGLGNLTHVGGDISVNFGSDFTGKWEHENDVAPVFQFRGSDPAFPLYEPVYFREMGEVSPLRNTGLYEALGETEAVCFMLAPSDGINTGRSTTTLSNGTTFNSTSQTLKTSREYRNTAFVWRTIDEQRERGSWFGHWHYQNRSGSPVSESLIGLNDHSAKKPHHISEIEVTSSEGRRYVYGLPAYNLEMKEVSFNLCEECGKNEHGQVEYEDGDNSLHNEHGRDRYYSATSTPAYAYAWLLTAVLSDDYEDLTQDGPTPDDLGSYTTFTYRKHHEAYRWRNPTAANEAEFQQGHTSTREDNKGHYVYGTKEVYYPAQIESRNYIAVFYTSDRNDALGVIDENGGTDVNQRLQKLDSIAIFSVQEMATSLQPRPVRSIHFEYDYSLASGQPNSISGQGKLTLKKVWFGFQHVTTGKDSPYEFHYRNNPEWHAMAADRWGNYKSVVEEGPDNHEFPYTHQEDELIRTDCSAWLLDSICLPQGGAMAIDYEADRYTHVQDRQAMCMHRILGVADRPDPGSYTDVLYEGESTINRYLFVQLNEPVTPGNEAEEVWALLKHIGHLYYKVGIQIAKRDDGYEEMPGFVPLAFSELDYGIKYGLQEGRDDVLWIMLPYVFKDGGETSSGPEYRFTNSTGGALRHPFAQAGFELIRSRFSHLIHDAYGTDYDDFLAALQQFGQAFVNVFSIGEENYLFNTQRCDRIKLNDGYVRLNAPATGKAGGGTRVRRLLIHDNWGRMQAGEEREELNYTYGSEFDYSLDGTCSGVASYEPLIGGDENPFAEPLAFRVVKALAADLNEFQMAPWGELFFPAPVVGYAQVTQRSLTRTEDAPEPGLRPRTAGFVTAGFYTSRDFPTLTSQTPMQAVHREVMLPFQFFNRRLNSSVVSQGFVVEVNDMHGKPKFRSVIGGDGTEMERTSYQYQLDESGRLRNDIQVIDPLSGNVSTALGGIEYDFVVDARNSTSSFDGNEVQIQTEVFMVGPAAVPIPIPLPAFTRNLSEFRSITTTKVIYRSGILESVVEMKRGSLSRMEQVAYDKTTGQVVIRAQYNEFGDPVYITEIPAFWAYPGMGSASSNIGYRKTEVSVGSGGSCTGLATGALSGGDELLLINEASGAHVRAWVFKAQGYQANLIDASGQPVVAGTYDLRVIRSGKQNKLTEVVATMDGLSDPIAGGSLDLSPAQWIQARVTTWSDYWHTDLARRVNGSQGSCQCTINPDFESAVSTMLNSLAALQSNPEGPGHENWVITGNRAVATITREDKNKETITCTVEISTTNGAPFPAQFAIAPSSVFQMNDCAAPDFITRSIGSGISVAITTDCLEMFNCSQGEDSFTATCSSGIINPFLNGILGNWRSAETWDPAVRLTNTGHVRSSGFMSGATAFGSFGSSGLTIAPTGSTWIRTASVDRYNIKGQVIEAADATGTPVATCFGFGALLNQATAKNAGSSDIALDSFEDYAYDVGRLVPEGSCVYPSHFHAEASFADYGFIDNSRSHTGRNSARVTPGVTVSYTVPTGASDDRPDRAARMTGNSFQIQSADLLRVFAPSAGRYRVSCWVYVNDPDASNYTQAGIRVGSTTLMPSGPVIDGWQQITGEVNISGTGGSLVIELLNLGAPEVWFDDLRIHPFESEVQSYVYDPLFLRIAAQLDQNNYATFFEYDDAGNLERTDLETRAGIYTLREVRSSLPKKP